jgi:hypothetical protein
MQMLENQPTLATTPLQCFSSLIGMTTYFSRASRDEPEETMKYDQFCLRWITMPRTSTEQLTILNPACNCSAEARASNAHQIGDNVLQCNSFSSPTEGAMLVHFLDSTFHRFWAPGYSSRRDPYLRIQCAACWTG